MGRANAYRQLLLQIIVTLLCTATALFVNWHNAYSAFLGGIAVVVPTYLFILCMFHYSGARATGKMMGSFIIGEIIKLVSMALLIVCAFKYVSVQPIAFLMSFLSVQVIATLLGFWWAGKATAVRA